MATQTFEEAVAEYLERSKALIEEEAEEGLPPDLPSPFDQSGPPYVAAVSLDSNNIRKYALSIMDDNPLFIDPSYGKHTKYGSQLAPPPILALVRYPSVHGAIRTGGYPVANFFSGAAWEYFDVIRMGSRFNSSKVTKDIFEKPGSRGNLIFLISDVRYWDFHGDLIAKSYGTQISLPVPEMGTSRVMNVESLGQKMLYERKQASYTQEQIQEAVASIESRKHRGPETLYWEDVEVGDKLGSVVLPPFTLQDQLSVHSVRFGLNPGDDYGVDQHAFENLFKRMRNDPEGGTRTNPITRWPWCGETEHEDAIMASYRQQPGPFDAGVLRVQMPHQLMTNWMGDDGFLRRFYMAIRKPVYYSDITSYTGEVVKKFKEVQEGDDKPGGAPGKTQYYAVGVRIAGTNQTGEIQSPGTATVYLPSREGGPVQLPIPHPANPPFIPYQTYYKEWY
jgi:hypothetical protein